MAVERLLLVDGTSRLLLVDGSSMLLLTTSTSGATTHAASGDLIGSGAVIAGSADRAGAAVEHVTSGALSGQGAEIVGVAAHVAIHATSGELIGAGSLLSGSAALPQEETVGGSGPGWAIDFAGIETRIAEERADREDRRRSIQNIFRRATGQPLPDDKPAEAVGAEMLSAVKPAARKRMQAEIKAIAEIDQSLARLEKQIEAADMAYILAEERDIVWIVSEYV